MISRRFSVVLFLFLGGFSIAQGEELRPLYRSTRSQGMGGVTVALPDDETAVFFNPAGLAGVKDLSWNLVSLDIEGSSDILTTYQESKEAFKKFDRNSINAVMGKNLYGRGTFSSIFQMPGFSLGMIADGQLALNPENIAMPQIEVGYQTTYGIQAGFGFSLRGGRRIRPGDGDWRIGIAPKMMMRRGGYHWMSTSQVLRLSEGKSLLNEIMGQYGIGFGADLGTQYVREVSRTLTLTGGVVFRDIGDTSFSSAASPIQNNLAVGASAKFDFGLLKVIAAYDMSHILQNTDWRQRNHLGLEFKLPMISLYTGYNQVFFTYGAACDFWFFRASASSYGQETGTFVQQDPTRRYILNLSFKLDF